MKKHIPNIISGVRIPLSVLLMFLTQRIALFLTVYTLCGITDIIDGRIARKFGLESELGSKLDGLGDFVFLASSFVSIVFIMKLRVGKTHLICIAILALYKAMNFIITKIKFKQWNSIHTFINVWLGLVVFLAVPVCITSNSIPNWLINTILILIAVAFIEETLILLTAKEYNVNRKSIFTK